MTERTVEDRLREEYFVLLPDVRRIHEELETEVRHSLLPLSSRLDSYERLEVVSRIKDCESALGALRRRQEARLFDPERANSYTLTALNDLAAVRVLAFPRSRWSQADSILRSRFSSWTSDPIPTSDENPEPIAFKYYGYCSRSNKLRGELQIVPMLVGLFWQVEHSAMYKPSPELKGVAAEPEMKERRSDVLRTLNAFEDEFERLIRSSKRK